MRKSKQIELCNARHGHCGQHDMYRIDWLYFMFLSQGGQGKQACSVADRLEDIFAKRIASVNATRESQLCLFHSARRL